MLNAGFQRTQLHRTHYLRQTPVGLRHSAKPIRRHSRSSRQPCTVAMTLLGSPVVIGTGAVVLTAVAAAVFDARRCSRLPKVRMQLNEFNRAVMSRCPDINSLYRMVPFLTNGYAPACCCTFQEHPCMLHIFIPDVGGHNAVSASLMEEHDKECK